MEMNKRLIFSALAAFISAAGLAASSTGANAYVVCDKDGDDCWHTDRRVNPPGVTFAWHPDDWYFHQHWDADRDHHWHDYHEGRGYWRNGVWITL